MEKSYAYSCGTDSISWEAKMSDVFSRPIVLRQCVK